MTELQLLERAAAEHGLDPDLDSSPAAVGSWEVEVEGQAVVGPDRTTRDYVALFDLFGPPWGGGGGGGGTAHAANNNNNNNSINNINNINSRSLLEGLLVLWATERAYLDAWSYAKAQGPPTTTTRDHSPPGQDQDQDPAADPDGSGTLTRRLIDNWTSDAFRAFVAEIEACLEALAHGQDTDTHEVLLASSISVVKKVFLLEEAFWPMVV